MKKYKVSLTKEEREELSVITQKGKHRSQKVLNSLILLNCDEGDCQENKTKNIDIANVLQISMRKIDLVKKGFARWSVRLLADKVVELKYVEDISHETIRRVLKKTKLNPGDSKVG